MKIARTIGEVRADVAVAREAGFEIAFVPTMGYLHEGHLSLVDLAAAGERRYTVVSIFVNPAQFGDSEDLDRYPRDEQRDLELLDARGVDLVFLPSVEEIYPDSFSTKVIVEGVTEPLEGAHRPGHFGGVATVVARLFGIVTPDLAVFGQKDAQQVALVRRLIADLAFPVELIVGSVKREQDGLAMSSRNVRLTEEERERASGLHSAMMEGRESWSAGTEIEEVEQRMRDHAESRGLEVEYLQIVDGDTFLSPRDRSDADLIVGAVRLGSVRLIDNVRLDGEKM